VKRLTEPSKRAVAEPLKGLKGSKMFSHLRSSNRVLVGESLRTRQLVHLIDKLGASRWPVLVLGETGTGKEVVARSIHQTDPVGPFVTIDCSALVGNIMESELFGHVKGAFTGAVGQKMGLIEAANGGTAFFDEIGELPLDMQSKLLRVLQEKEFRPVGSLSARRSDFRVIAATNRDLAKEVERGTFRRDLYYRLNVVTLKIAPLRDRREDIPLLMNHFLVNYGRGHRFTQEALDAIMSYEWPGNVRELENCIQHVVAIHTGPLLNVTDLPSQIQNHLASKRAASVGVAVGGYLPPMPPLQPIDADRAGAPVRLASGTPILPLVEIERRAIQQALDYTKGDRGVAASLLGIGRTTLYRKIKEYQLAC
jgi:transcriptional regulator with PAS, ATPase and Fis domain